MAFPIFDNNINFNNKDILSFLYAFPNHHIFMNRTIDDMITHHRFKNGLHIRLHWKEFTSIYLSFPLSIEKIDEYIKNGNLKLNKFVVLSYSSPSYSASKEEFSIFRSTFKHKRYKLTNSEYQNAEFSDSINIHYQDLYFDELKNKAYLNYEFEKFYSNKKRHDS